MKIVGLIDSFKNSFNSLQASHVLKEALTSFDVDAIPVSDGGENTVINLTRLFNGKIIDSKIYGPDGSELKSYFGNLEDEKTAIIESAEGAGIEKIVVGKQPLTALSSFGVGQQISQALDLGVEKIIVGLGGTCTIDGGLGMLTALGVKFYAKTHELIDPFNFQFEMIDKIDLSQIDKRLEKIEIVLASDVDNVLLGTSGAVHTFGQQKGLLTHQLASYDKGLRWYANKLSIATNTNNIEKKHTGAAGGIGFALMCVAKCQWVNGHSLFLENIEVIEAIKNCDYIVTGEGKFDTQSLNGKLISGVLKLANKYNKPIIIICGINEVTDLPKEVVSIITLSDYANSREDSINNGIHYFEQAVNNELINYFNNHQL